MSLIGEDLCKNATPPVTLSFFTASISLTLALVTTTGNSLVVLAVVLDPNKDLKCPFNYFVANLAVADLLVGVVVEPTSVVFHIREGLGLGFPSSVHMAFHMCYFISCTASLLSLAALAIDRYMAISYPLQYRVKLSSNRAGIASACIWAFSLSFPFIYFEVGYLAYAFVFANTAVPATFVVLMLTYLRIFRKFHAQVKNWDELHESTEHNRDKKRAIAWERKVTKTFLIMLALFIGCFLPSCVFIYLMNLCGSCGCVFINWARDLHFLLALTNSCMNPFLYAWRLETFRKAFWQILCCCRSTRKKQGRLIQQ